MKSHTTSLLNPSWLTNLNEFTKLFIGFSGGLDSTVLLHALASHPNLRSKLTAVHINHGISAQAKAWQQHCEQFCRDLGINFITESVHFDRSANIEEGARNARYAVFTSLLTTNDALILGHHQDDQAETLLLQLFRGAGVDGLAAMAESGSLGFGMLLRPLLSHSRAQLEYYAALHQLIWVNDDSNQDVSYSRNYLRHQVMPLLVDKWPSVVGNISRTARHCQQAKNNLDALALNDYETLITPSSAREDEIRILPFKPLQNLNEDRIVNILRTWLKKNKVKLPSTATFNRLIQEMIFASEDANPVVSWGNILIRRYQAHLYLERQIPSTALASTEWLEFPSPLILADAGVKLVAVQAAQGLHIPEHAKIEIRFRQGGEEFLWHGQNKRLKKLFQEWGIPTWLRDTIPLVYINNQLAVITGYAVSDAFFIIDSSRAWLLSSEPQNARS